VRAMGIRDRPTSYRSPWQNGYVERLIGSIRRECTDHLLVFNVEHLRRILSKIDAEARRPLTSRQFDIECPDFTKNVAHAHCVNASAQQSPQHSRSGPHPTRYLKGLGELLLAQADALRPSAADD
jgi:transposase InsO family protein